MLKHTTISINERKQIATQIMTDIYIQQCEHHQMEKKVMVEAARQVDENRQGLKLPEGMQQHGYVILPKHKRMYGKRNCDRFCVLCAIKYSKQWLRTHHLIPDGKLQTRCKKQSEIPEIPKTAAQKTELIKSCQ